MRKTLQLSGFSWKKDGDDDDDDDDEEEEEEEEFHLTWNENNCPTAVFSTCYCHYFYI